MEASPVALVFLFFLFVFFFSPLLLHPPRCTDRDSAAEEKNVDDEIKRKVCRFAGGVIRKASGGLVGGGVFAREYSRNIWRKLAAFIFFQILGKPLFAL